MKTFLCWLILVIANVASAADSGGFLFVTFDSEGSQKGEQIYFGLSQDGLHWEAIPGRQPVLTSEIGEQGVRDPYLLRAENGKFYLLATDLSIFLHPDWKRAVERGSRSIVIWESNDLVQWSQPRLVEVASPEAGCTWAPEAIYEPKRQAYLVYWASTTKPDGYKQQRIWGAWTKDFRQFSAPFVYLEKPTTVIDTDIVRGGDGKYYRFTKDEKEKSITMEVSSSVLGPWQDVPGFSLGKEKGVEGPACFQLKPAANGKPATWCLLLDAFARKGGYQPFVTEDLASGKFTPGTGFQFPFRFRHGSVLPLTAAEYARVKAKYVAPAGPAVSDRGTQPPTPILDGFTADPSIRVFGDTYYVYPTSDKPNWLTTDFSVWSSKNLVTWKKEGLILDVAHDLQWANIKAWAPDCIERDGTYYFYFCADGKIGVATAKMPAGPFKDALNKPLLARQGKNDKRITSNTIDPYPFIDDNGQAYLYWGNSAGAVNVVKLKSDMISLADDPHEFVIQGNSSGRPINFREGIVVFKRTGKYYFMWSVDDARSDDYRVAFGTAEHPYGPVQVPANATVLSKNGPAKGTGHHSVVNVPGTDRWYAVYHRHAIPNGSGYQREVCLSRMEFNSDGSIKPMDPLVQTFRSGDRGEPIVNGKGRPDAP